jgi:hypothetical protein
MKGTKPAKQLASAERQERLLRIIELYTLGERCSLTDYQLARLARVPRWSVSPALRALERARGGSAGTCATSCLRYGRRGRRSGASVSSRSLMRGSRQKENAAYYPREGRVR